MFRSSNYVVESILPKVNEEEENLRLKCNFCSKKDLSETELLLHQSVKHTKKITHFTNENPFYCRICIKDCTNSANLLEHIKLEHLYTSGDSFRVQREIFICDHCGTVFFSKQLLEVHLLHSPIQNPNVPMQCVICLKYIFSRSMWKHLQGHDIQNVAMCPICFVKCRNRKLLLDHMKTHPRYLKCDMCMYETKREDFFRQHVIDKHKTNITCKNDNEYSKYFTPQYSGNWKHQKMGSLGVKLTNDLRICVLCREICVGDSNMKQHVCVEHKWKLAEVKPKHLCTCGEMFTNKVLLKHHTFKLKGDHKMLE